MAVSDFHKNMMAGAVSGRSDGIHRTASPSTGDARYVQQAAAARRQVQGRQRDRRTFRNPQAVEPGVFGYKGFLRPETGNFLTDAMRFSPLSLLAGVINSATTGPRDTGAEYTLNTQSGAGAGVGASQALANMQSRRLAANQRAEDAYGRPAAPAPAPVGTAPVQTSPLLGYGFEEDKFGFNPQTPRATLNDLDIDLNPGYSQVADGQYVPSYNPFEATAAAQAQLAPDAADLELNQWLQTEQGSRYNNPDLPEDFVRRMFETSKRLNAGKY